MIESALGNQITIAAFAGLLLFAAVSDVLLYKIPNKAVVAILVIYPVHVAVSPAPVDWLMALMVSAVVLAGGFALFAFGKLGAGDAKLLTAVTLWAGPVWAPLALFVCAISGGLLGLIMLTRFRFALAGALSASGWQQASEALLSKEMPYGVPIALAGFVVCLGLFAPSLMIAPI